MDYYTQKAKRMYGLFLKGEPCRKVYAAVRKGDKYVVIENPAGKKWKYQIAGGGVENGETNQEAIVREILEELNIIAKITKSLGVINYNTNWKYEDKEFSVKNEAEIFLAEFITYANNKKLGLEGENINNLALISEEQMCANVYEFASGGITLN